MIIRYAVLLTAFVGVCGCASSDAQQDARFEEACETYGQDANGNTVVVMRDESHQTAVAAVGVTANGGLNDWAALAGPGVATSRGGALAYQGGGQSTQMRPCPTTQTPPRPEGK